MKKQNRRSDKISLFKSNLQSPLKTNSDSENETIIITQQPFHRKSSSNSDNVIVTLSGDESDNNIGTEELDVYEGFNSDGVVENSFVNYSGERLDNNINIESDEVPNSDSHVVENSIVIHSGEESDNNVNTAEELNIEGDFGDESKASDTFRKMHSPYVENNSESEEHIPQPTLRKSVRARKDPVIFTYDEVGGNPTKSRRHFR